ncbi:unnamed protein product [Mycena citricolor]|uniref:Uncharacterized protein n=1 Tax=Mycena citricolor TaxID=2018698 RepID=A0AAD2K861_9AGAR|nr:unnamed protein product [Mycena citricolor]
MHSHCPLGCCDVYPVGVGPGWSLGTADEEPGVFEGRLRKALGLQSEKDVQQSRQARPFLRKDWQEISYKGGGRAESGRQSLSRRRLSLWIRDTQGSQLTASFDVICGWLADCSFGLSPATDTSSPRNAGQTPSSPVPNKDVDYEQVGRRHD